MTADDGVGLDLVAERRPSVRVFSFGTELVLYEDAHGTLHHLNPQAALVWRCLDGSGPLSELAADLADAYGVDRATVEGDVLGMVGHLARSGMLSGVGPGAEPAPETPAGPVPAFLSDPPAP